MIIQESIYENLESPAYEIADYIIDNYKEFKSNGVDAYPFLHKYFNSMAEKYKYTPNSADYIKAMANTVPIGTHPKQGQYNVSIEKFKPMEDVTAGAYEECYRNERKIVIKVPFVKFVSETPAVANRNRNDRKILRRQLRHELVHAIRDLTHSYDRSYPAFTDKAMKQHEYETEVNNSLGRTKSDKKINQLRHEYYHNSLAYKNNKSYIKYKAEFEQYIQKFLRRCEGLDANGNDDGSKQMLVINSYKQLLTVMFGSLYHPGYENDESLKRMVANRLKDENFPDDPKYKKVKMNINIVPRPVDSKNRLLSSVFNY